MTFSFPVGLGFAMASSVVRAVVITFWIGLTGCYFSHERPGLERAPDASPARRDGGHDAAMDASLDAPEPFDAGRDASQRMDGGFECEGGVILGDTSDVAVDLLFVVDSSGSMSEEQLTLSTEVPRLVRVLGSGDRNGDGAEDFPPVRSLRVGVVTTNMGLGHHSIGCTPFGDDAVLRTTPGGARPECEARYPNFLTYEPEIGGLDRFAEDFSCVAQVGTDGCGIEQPLEAALKALTPSSSEVTFARGSRGHGDGANGDFRRQDAVLGIIMVTDEDDCSLSNLDLFDPEGPWEFRQTSLGLRCFEHEEATLHPVSRYVDGFAALVDDPAKLVVAAIAGVPPDLVEDGAEIDYERVLADPRMQPRPDPLREGILHSSCSVLGRVNAAPPNRLVRTVREFGDKGIVQSICDETFLGALDAIIDQLGRAVIEVECVEEQ